MKLSVGNVPLSADDVIKMALKIWVVKCSLQWEKNLPRDKDRKLTNWKTVFIFITIPTTPLPKMCTMGVFSVKLYHREMKKTRAERNTLTICCLTMQQQHAQTWWFAWPVLGQDISVLSPTSHYQELKVTPLTSTRREGKPQKLSPHLDQERRETPETMSP